MSGLLERLAIEDEIAAGAFVGAVIGVAAATNGNPPVTTRSAAKQVAVSAGAGALAGAIVKAHRKR